jgi:hypothetical protein
MYGSWDWGILGCNDVADIIDVAYDFKPGVLASLCGVGNIRNSLRTLFNQAFNWII